MAVGEKSNEQGDEDFDRGTIARIKDGLPWTRSALGQQLRALRESRGLTQARLAELAGISRMTVIRYEAGDDQQSPEGVEIVIKKLEDLPQRSPPTRTFEEARKTLAYLASETARLKAAQATARELGWETSVAPQPPAPQPSPSPEATANALLTKSPAKMTDQELEELIKALDTLREESKRELIGYIRGFIAALRGKR